eukprot:3346387-Rhodomonas_salina.3
MVESLRTACEGLPEWQSWRSFAIPIGKPAWQQQNHDQSEPQFAQQKKTNSTVRALPAACALKVECASSESALMRPDPDDRKHLLSHAYGADNHVPESGRAFSPTSSTPGCNTARQHRRLPNEYDKRTLNSGCYRRVHGSWTEYSRARWTLGIERHGGGEGCITTELRFATPANGFAIKS